MIASIADWVSKRIFHYPLMGSIQLFLFWINGRDIESNKLNCWSVIIWRVASSLHQFDIDYDIYSAIIFSDKRYTWRLSLGVRGSQSSEFMTGVSNTTRIELKKNNVRTKQILRQAGWFLWPVWEVPSKTEFKGYRKSFLWTS